MKVILKYAFTFLDHNIRTGLYKCNRFHVVVKEKCNRFQVNNNTGQIIHYIIVYFY